MNVRIEQFPSQTAEWSDDELVGHQRRFEEIHVSTIVPADIVASLLRPAVPPDILLGSLRDGRLKVVSPITVKLAVEDRHIIAEAVEFNEFGFGNNPSEAVSDLQRAIAELYLTLEQEQNRLGPDLQRVWEKLGQKIQKHDH